MNVEWKCLREVGEMSDDDLKIRELEYDTQMDQLAPSKEKDIPCPTRFSLKGSIISAIMVDIIATLDHIGVFNLSTGHRSLLLLDRHGSIVELPFLSYINDDRQPWVV